MQLQKVNKGILPLLLILGLLKITGLNAIENQKGKPDVSADYDEDESFEPETPVQNSPGEIPYFDKGEVIVHATHEGENITLNCQPHNFIETKHIIVWYRNGTAITNGNNTLGPSGDFALDTVHKLIIFNYNKTSPYNFRCDVEPQHARQNITIVFHAPDNMAERNGASNNNINMNYLISNLQIAVMTIVLLMTACAWN